MHIHSYQVFNSKPLFLHTYVFPLYFLPILIGYFKEYYVTTIITLLCTTLLFLFTLWSVELKILFTLKKVGFVNEECLKNNCKVEVSEPKGKYFKKSKYIFYRKSLCKFENDLFIYKYNSFIIINGFINHLSVNLNQTFKALKSGLELPEFIKKFPKNEFKIIPPSFLSLFYEHATAPFFVFQMFCGVLWCLDEYVYHALFTIFMLVLFEMGVVFQRIRTISEFKNMNLPPILVKLVQRNKKNFNQSISSIDLLPGDVVELNEPMKIPCDLLILEGNCAVNESILSGESTLNVKEDISSRESLDFFNYKRDRAHILYSGTDLLKSNIKALVIKTGFNTLQGNLIRKMINSDSTISNQESYFFLLFLLFFGILSAFYTYLYSKSEGYKKILEIILILTNVVPPELPMELTIAVNNALQSLMRLGVFCLEPFKIPFAGKIDICCFDKTGTLTESIISLDQLIYKEIFPIKLVISACHSLILLNEKIEGDFMEKIVFEHLKIQYKQENQTEFDDLIITTIKKYSFDSNLKRMTVIVLLDDFYYVLVKGAPEILEKLLKKVPEDFFEYKKYAKQGSRILGCAYKKISKDEYTFNKSNRNNLEKDLVFAGFILFNCKLKEESYDLVNELVESKHKVVIITGDNLLTTESVADKLGLLSKYRRFDVSNNVRSNRSSSTYINTEVDCIGPMNADDINNTGDSITGDGITGDSITGDSITGDDTDVINNTGVCDDTDVINNTDDNTINTLEEDIFTLGVEGDQINEILESPDFFKAVIFARANPKQKERIIEKYKNSNLITLMCGDGTNDVGALKSAHVGIAILEKSNITTNEQIKPGDASVAASFTSKSGLKSVLEIIRHGRSALVTTIQMHKILALNSLISAFSLSVLDIKGIRFSDFQMTLTGILLAFSFMFLTTSKPLNKIHSKKPITKIFTKYILTSIIGQSIIHILSFYLILNFIPEIKEFTYSNNTIIFTPNLLNTAIFILTLSQQLNTFIINYIGRPFRESILENKPLFGSLLGLLSFIVLVLFNRIDEKVEVVDLGVYKNKVMCVLVFDFLGCYLVEKVCKLLGFD